MAEDNSPARSIISVSYTHLSDRRTDACKYTDYNSVAAAFIDSNIYSDKKTQGAGSHEKMEERIPPGGRKSWGQFDIRLYERAGFERYKGSKANRRRGGFRQRTAHRE